MENDKNLENGGKGKNNGKQKIEDDDKQIGKRIDNKTKELQRIKLKPKESFQPFYEKSRDCPRFKDGIPCIKFLLKGYCHSKCNRLHHLSNDQLREFKNFINNIKDSIKEQVFQQGSAEIEP